MVTGIVTCVIVNPMWVLKVRLTEKKGKGSTLKILNEILQKEGVRSLWNGVGISCLGCLEGALQFLIVEELKRRENGRNGSVEMGLFWLFWIGSGARLFGVVVCYPYQAVRSLYQSEKFDGFEWKRDCRFSVLYGGLSVKICKEIFYGGLFTMVREKIIR